MMVAYMTERSHKRGTIRQELRGLLMNPFTTVLLLFIFGLLVWGLPPKSFMGGGTVVGRILDLNRDPEREFWFSYPQPTSMYIVKETDRFRAIDPDQESWDELSRLSQGRPKDLFEVRYEVFEPLAGFWAPTRRGVTERIVVLPMSGGHSPEVLRAVRAEAVRAFGRKWGREVSHLTFADRTTSKIRVEGYVENLLSVIVVGALVLSLGWVPPTWRWVRSRRRQRRVRHGLCPGCGYPLAGLTAGECPECGTGLEAKEHDPGAGPGS
jgi:hypothetical protein